MLDIPIDGTKYFRGSMNPYFVWDLYRGIIIFKL